MFKQLYKAKFEVLVFIKLSKSSLHGDLLYKARQFEFIPKCTLMPYSISHGDVIMSSCREIAGQLIVYVLHNHMRGA